MKFSIERRALIKKLEVIGRKDPSKKWRDKEVRLLVCDARVFVEANESIAGVEALVFKDGSCSLDYKLFLKLLKMHSKKKHLTFEADDHRITFATTTLPVTRYSKTATPPGKFKVFPVTDDWISQGRMGTETSTQLPNVEKAIIDREKILNYLLNLKHPAGANKARYFFKFGFSARKWEEFATALRIHAQTHNVKKVSETGFGPRYEVEGKLSAPDGRSPHIRSVWQLDKGAVAPRLITAYPLEAR